MSETFINSLQEKGPKNLEGKEEEERRHHQVRLSMKKYLKRSSSQVHHGYATIWTNHRTVRAAMKKKVVVLPAEFARSPG